MNILCIETSTDVCSVAMARDGAVVALRESPERDHAARAAVFVAEVLAEAEVTAGSAVSAGRARLDAVAVSRGPGSYTGLRIGTSLAKGLCFGLDIPLISVGSLNGLAAQVGVGGVLIPMIDARRMEVYCQVFEGARAVSDVEAKVMDENSFSEWRDKKEVYIFGDGAEKCRDVLPWAKYVDVKASARGMARLAEEALAAGKTEDVAYFEPFYLKDFIITTPKK